MNAHEQLKNHPDMMMDVFRASRNPDGTVPERGLAGLAAIIYHTHEGVVEEVFVEFLRLLSEEGFAPDVEAFQKARYN